MPTASLEEEEVVWTHIHGDVAAARRFVADAAGGSLAVLAVGVAPTHVHSLAPELRLLLEARAACGDATRVVWVNREPAGALQPRPVPGPVTRDMPRSEPRSAEMAEVPPLELLGDAAEVVGKLVAAAEELVKLS